MNLLKVKNLLFGCLLFCSAAIFAEPVEFSLKTETKSIQAGTPFWVALDLQIEDGWHAYWKNPGEAGMAPQISWDLPPGFSVQAIEWPYPSSFNIGSVKAFGYEGPTVLLAKLLPPPDLKETSVDLKFNLTWVVCNDETCLPGSSEGTMILHVKKGPPELNQESAEYFEEARGRIPQKSEPLKTNREKSVVESILQTEQATPNELAEAEFFPENKDVDVKVTSEVPGEVKLTFKEDIQKEPLKGVLVVGDKAYEIDLGKMPASSENTAEKELDSFLLALLFAFIGGAILNLMPCVLPVVSLKVLSFVNLAKECPWMRLKQGLYFTLGVLVSFWVLAGALLLLQAWGHSVGWGFQLQEPLFVAILAALMLIFALSLFGVFEMGALFASWAGDHEVKTKEGPLSSFFSGVLATAVATPCTGPFLGSAVGYAFTLPPGYSLTIFTFLALGMALPYLILTSFPPLLRFVPRPGKWMETFKQAMGFIMLLATLWLTWVFAGETQDPATILLLFAFFAIGLVCWILGKWGTPLSSPVSRFMSGAIALCLLFGAFKVMSLASAQTPAHEIAVVDTGWEPFSTKRLEELRAQGKPVFIDFTAKWCLICQTNHLVLVTTPVQAKMQQKGVVKMKADWTKNDPEITAELKKWGRSGVPLYILYKEDGAAKILPQVLTPDAVIASLDEIADVDG